MEKNLTENEKYLRDFFDNALVGFHIFGPDRKIIDINQAELDMIGYEYREIVGKKKWSDLILPEEKPLFAQHWRTLMSTGKVLNYHYTLRHKNGKLISVVLYATARFDDAGKLLNTRGIVVDNTSRKEMEAALRTLQDDMNKKRLEFEERSLALNEILARVEMEKKKIQQNVLLNIDQLIMPILTQLKRKGTDLDQRNIGLLEKNLKQLTSAFGSNVADHRWKLSPREIEICNMIKNGLSTKEVADLLSVSCRTVDNHRNHIRKKLNILNDDVHLVSYLKSLS